MWLMAVSIALAKASAGKVACNAVGENMWRRKALAGLQLSVSYEMTMKKRASWCLSWPDGREAGLSKASS